MTTLERYAVTIAESACRPKKFRTPESKYAEQLEDVTRAAVQPQPRERCVKPETHRADQEAFRRLQPIREKAEVIARREGKDKDVVAAQLALLAKVAAKRETTDNIGRAV